jgi:hypothetical protein
MTPLEDYNRLVRDYMTEPDFDKCDAMLADVLAAGRRAGVLAAERPADALPTPQPTVADLIAAEQARARRRHPNDHAGHPSVTPWDRLLILDSEVDEVEREIATGNTGTAMIWEVLQVASVAADWVQAWLDDPEAMPASDLLAIIEDGVIR